MGLVSRAAALGGGRPARDDGPLHGPADAPERRSRRRRPGLGRGSRAWSSRWSTETRTRVRGARVVIGVRGDYANKRGRAYLPIKRRTALSGSRLRSSGTQRGSCARLQAAAARHRALPAGAPVDDVRRQRAPHAGPSRDWLRPPFKVVWSRGLGSLVEFPPSSPTASPTSPTTRPRLRPPHEQRHGALAAPAEPRKMASSPAIVGDELVVHGMDGIVRVLDRRNGGCAGTSASARRSSRRRSSPAGSTTSAPGTAASTRST